MSSGLRKLAVMFGSLLFMALLFLGAELTVRVLGIQPRDWPAAGFKRSPEQIKVDPLLGPLPRPNWSGRWFNLFATAFDARGFRLTGLPPPADPTLRVAFVGDSCTFGWGLDGEQTFIGAIDALQRQAGAPSVELLNAAYPGQSAVVGEHLLVERVLPLHPDVVVIGYGANNAFRFSLVADRERFRNYSLRRWIFRSRLLHIIAAWQASKRGADPDPRRRESIDKLPLAQVKRVAPPDEFAHSERQMVRDARAAGAKPLIMILPRASGVSTDFRFEDAARARDASRQAADAGATTASGESLRDRVTLEFSCIDHRDRADALGEMREQQDGWHPVYPDRLDVRALLRDGARAYVAGAFAAAVAKFAAAVAAQPDSPLAFYDLGVAQIAAGDAESGLRALHNADRLACSIFLHYQVVAWSVGLEEGVPVVDLTPWFQAHDGEPLFLDPAHPNIEGSQIIAQALWPAIQKLAGS
ncbi:MAG: SGNH/GDSL hydrolase family protein [Deltaproteobacteria bacterium]|nr:SGNH/GDSL hydrolase family protein [Deltaproteobacteria bacterium]